ncbi:hypothetical protein ACQKLP_17690 [Chitinophaga sp. NPDC101104]|uniref:hypothetical protein n=1 Tax=Chitinophaga sp. NPDC101104 TaxID=3390561 RepID=UPI003CFF5172
MMRIALLFTMIFGTLGCNYSLFVKKDRVISVRYGYLLLHRDQQIFFPVKKAQEVISLSQIEGKVGYLIFFENELQTYREAAQKVAVEYTYRYGSEMVSRIDSIGIMAVEIRSVPYQNKGKRGLDTLSFKHDQVPVKLRFYNTNNEGVLSVYPIFNNDIKKLQEYYN